MILQYLKICHGVNNLYISVQEHEHVATIKRFRPLNCESQKHPKKVLIESLVRPLPIGISLAEGPRSNSAGVRGPRVSSNDA